MSNQAYAIVRGDNIQLLQIKVHDWLKNGSGEGKGRQWIPTGGVVIDTSIRIKRAHFYQAVWTNGDSKHGVDLTG